MRNAILKSLHVAAIALACVAPGAHAQNNPLTSKDMQAAVVVKKVHVPEPSSPALLAVDLLPLGAALLLLRRRRVA